MLGWLGGTEECLRLVRTGGVFADCVACEQHRLERAGSYRQFPYPSRPDGHAVAPHHDHAVRFTVVCVLGLRHEDNGSVLNAALTSGKGRYVERHRRHSHLAGRGQPLHGRAVEERL
ncbi:nitrilase-related carbon-nitrogen hydrolase [Streptomyces sp. NBC_01013]|uniref:nitrilase-related carbon-nitrogen hydrolase n=1 Tax=Streptomyces sp. NBC_01013 TaxID=2903718 RepID=UPI0038698B77